MLADSPYILQRFKQRTSNGIHQQPSTAVAAPGEWGCLDLGKARERTVSVLVCSGFSANRRLYFAQMPAIATRLWEC